MNTLSLRPRQPPAQRGAILVTVLILTLIGLAGTSAFLKYSTGDTYLTRRSIEEQRAQVACEAGLEYGISRLKDVIMWYRLSPYVGTNELRSRLNAITPPQPMGAFAFALETQSFLRFSIDSTNSLGIITNGTACRGSHGSYQYFTVTCGVINTNTGTRAALRQTVQAVGLSLIRFGVFYEEDLEILPGPTMTFQGPVHANGNLYVGGPLQFFDRLTARGHLRHRRKDTTDRPGEVFINNASNQSLSMITGGRYLDSDQPDWMAAALARWDGRVMNQAHGVPRLSPPIHRLDDSHDIIERALPTNDVAYQAITEREKFSNKAALRIHVASNGVVNCYTNAGTDANDLPVFVVYTNVRPVTLAQAGTNAWGQPLYAKTTNGTYRFATNSPARGIYDVSQTNLYDARENRYVAPVDLYVDRLQAVLTNLYTAHSADTGRGIIYITRDPPAGTLSGRMPAVRLRNGYAITNAIGLTVVSDLPVYIEGHFNATNAKPALVAGDAVTMLSTNWQDANSIRDSAQRVARDTTFNTVVMTGNYATQTNLYNGGLENVLRFLENWSGRTTTFRGSIIDLWSSETATGRWYYGTAPAADSGLTRYRYDAPNRDWGYDEIYRTVSPPGMTHVFGMEEVFWERIPWGMAGF